MGQHRDTTALPPLGQEHIHVCILILGVPFVMLVDGYPSKVARNPLPLPPYPLQLRLVHPSVSPPLAGLSSFRGEGNLFYR